jgi:Icc protein
MRIAHLTDLHVLERDAARRRGSDRARLELLCNERSVDPEDRRSRLLRALAQVADSGADHLVVTGDLTEDGAPAQFEYLAEILHEGGVDPERTTLVAGNHDAYSGYEAYENALAGPLGAFAKTSRAGSVVDLGSAAVLPVCSRMEQPFIRAAGIVGTEARAKLARSLRDRAFSHTPCIVAVHHPLVTRTLPAWHWFDGLVDAPEMTRLLANHRHATVLHGHFHRKMDLPIGDEVRARARGAQAVVDHRQPMRLYDLVDGQFVPSVGGRTTPAPHLDRSV